VACGHAPAGLDHHLGADQDIESDGLGCKTS
jgi:hypothetical protein